MTTKTKPKNITRYVLSRLYRFQWMTAREISETSELTVQQISIALHNLIKKGEVKSRKQKHPQPDGKFLTEFAKVGGGCN